MGLHRVSLIVLFLALLSINYFELEASLFEKEDAVKVVHINSDSLPQGWNSHIFEQEDTLYSIPVPTLNGPNISRVYGFYRSQPRKIREYTYYSIMDANVGRLYADYFNQYAADKNLGYFEKADLVIAFVQSLPYSEDNVSTGYDDYPRFPIETLIDNQGDCEDTSILLSSILRNMGYEVVLLEPPEHMAVGLAVPEEMSSDADRVYFTDEKNRSYAYIETTDIGYRIGEMPVEYEGRPVTIHHVVPRPIITYSWEFHLKKAFFTWASYSVSLDLDNEGSDDAENVRILFEAGSGDGIIRTQSEPFTIPINSSHRSHTDINVPLGGQHLKITVEGDNFEPIYLESEFF